MRDPQFTCRLAQGCSPAWLPPAGACRVLRRPALSNAPLQPTSDPTTCLSPSTLCSGLLHPVPRRCFCDRNVLSRPPSLPAGSSSPKPLQESSSGRTSPPPKLCSQRPVLLCVALTALNLSWGPSPPSVLSSLRAVSGFSQEGTGALRGAVTCSRSHRQGEARLEEPGGLGSGSPRTSSPQGCQVSTQAVKCMTHWPADKAGHPACVWAPSLDSVGTVPTGPEVQGQRKQSSNPDTGNAAGA